MNMMLAEKKKRPPEKRAKELLVWLVKFLPGAVPPSPEEAILDVSDDVHALFWHRSELQKIIEKSPGTLNMAQHRKLELLDQQIKTNALLLVGAGKGMLRRYREGRYVRSHWWWYLDDILQEEAMAKSREMLKVLYGDVVNAKRSLAKVAEKRVVYQRKVKTKK